MNGRSWLPSPARAIGVDLIDLAAPVVVADEGQLRAVLDPRQPALVLGGGCQAAVVAAVGVHDIDLGVAGILRHAVVGHCVGHLPSVGRDGHVAYPAHRPQGFGGQTSLVEGDFGLAYQLSVLCRAVRPRSRARGECYGHRHGDDVGIIHVAMFLMM